MYDPETHVHRNHIRNGGGTGYGRLMLTPEQARRVEDVLETHSAEARRTT